MAKVVQFDTEEKRTESPLTPELKEFICRVIVPILVEQYIAEQDAEEGLEKDGIRVGESHGKPAA